MTALEEPVHVTTTSADIRDLLLFSGRFGNCSYRVSNTDRRDVFFISDSPVEVRLFKSS